MDPVLMEQVAIQACKFQLEYEYLNRCLELRNVSDQISALEGQIAGFAAQYSEVYDLILVACGCQHLSLVTQDVF